MPAFDDLMATVDVAIRGRLGGAVTYAPGTGDPVEVDGVFDANYVRVDLGQAGVASVGPAVFLRLEDLPSNPETDTDATVTYAGVEYTAHTVQPDGIGGVHLLLHRTT